MSIEARRFVASGVMLLMLLALLGALVYIPIPQANRDLVITILSILVGAGSAAVPNLFGDRDSEKDRLRAELGAVKHDLAVLQVAHELLNKKHDELMRMLVERHVVKGVGIELSSQAELDFPETRPQGGG